MVSEEKEKEKEQISGKEEKGEAEEEEEVIFPTFPSSAPINSRRKETQVPIFQFFIGISRFFLSQF